MFPSKDLCTPWSKKSPDCVQCSSEVEAADAVDGLAPLGGEAGGVDEVVDPVGSVDEEDLKVFHLRPHVGTPRDLTLEDFFYKYKNTYRYLFFLSSISNPYSFLIERFRPKY